MSNTELNELMERLTISVDGKRGLLELTANANVYHANKFNEKAIKQAGLIVGRDISAINVELFEDDNTICNASIKDGKWEVIADSDDSTTSVARTGTYKSGQKELPDSEKLHDMRFDMEHIVKELIKQFFPQLKVRGTSDGIRSKYQLMLIKSIKLHLKTGMSKDDIQKELQDDTLTQEIWDKMFAVAKAEMAESA